MSTSINKPSHTSPPILTDAATFIGIDYHKKYSAWHALDAARNDLGKGRIEHDAPQDFGTLVKRWSNPRVFHERGQKFHVAGFQELDCFAPRDRSSGKWVRGQAHKITAG